MPDLVSNIGLPNIIACLRSATEESAMVIVALYDRLNTSLQQVCDIDYLIAAARCKDPHEIAGLICKQYSKIKAIETQMVAATESPEVMKKTAKHAKQKDGFQHAKLLLQTTGVAPVPTNQRNIMIGNKIDNRQQTQINTVVHTHKEFIDDVATILAKLPVNVSSPENSGEDQGHRRSQED